MGPPIDFIFDGVVGFLEMADRMDQLPVAPNPRWWPDWSQQKQYSKPFNPCYCPYACNWWTVTHAFCIVWLWQQVCRHQTDRW